MYWFWRQNCAMHIKATHYSLLTLIILSKPALLEKKGLNNSALKTLASIFLSQL
jgi:hypothetical protein